MALNLAIALRGVWPSAPAFRWWLLAAVLVIVVVTLVRTRARTGCAGDDDSTPVGGGPWTPQPATASTRSITGMTARILPSTGLLRRVRSESPAIPPRPVDDPGPRRPVRPARRRPAVSLIAHRALQPPMHVLHAGGGAARDPVPTHS